MDVLNKLRNNVYMLGIRETDGKYGLRVRSYILIEAIMMVTVLYYLQNRWNVVEDRYIGLKAVLFIMTFISYSLSYMYYWNDVSQIFVMFEEMNYRIPYFMSKQRCDVIISMERDMRKFSKLWRMLVIAYTLSTCISPLLYVLLKVFYFHAEFQQTIKENLSSQYPLEYPKYSEYFQQMESSLNLIIYVLVYFMHTIYMLYNCIYAQLANVSTLCSMTHLEHELKLLRLSLVEMDDLLDKSFYEEIKNKNLKRFWRYFVKHHQDTYRKVRIVNRGIRWVTSTISFISSLYMCLSVYTIVEKEQVLLKIQEAVFFAIWALDIYFFDLCGERIKTEGENLRNALYECSWLEKPKWFRSSLLVAMTRSYHPIQLKPFGVISLNLNSFALSMNAAYSYYNLLHNFKRK